MGVILVGMADLKAAKHPETLTTLGLGSCVGITLFDSRTKTGGLAHIMLPDSTSFGGQNRAKFADTAIPDLISLMVSLGAIRQTLVAKLAGGAHMFGGSQSDVLNIGKRNAAACAAILAHLRIPVLANDTGGSYGRTIELITDSGALKIKTVGHGEKFI